MFLPRNEEIIWLSRDTPTYQIIYKVIEGHSGYSSSSSIVSSTPFKENHTVYVEQCLYLQYYALPPPLSITTNYKILCTLIL
jgi:hypothetical protein